MNIIASIVLGAVIITAVITLLWLTKHWPKDPPGGGPW
jgi:hypothetical protein